jgi:hypothetical protein
VLNVYISIHQARLCFNFIPLPAQSRECSVAQFTAPVFAGFHSESIAIRSLVNGFLLILIQYECRVSRIVVTISCMQWVFESTFLCPLFPCRSPFVCSGRGGQESAIGTAVQAGISLGDVASAAADTMAPVFQPLISPVHHLLDKTMFARHIAEDSAHLLLSLGQHMPLIQPICFALKALIVVVQVSF